MESKIVAYETHFKTDSNGKPIEVGKVPLTQPDLESRTLYWKMKYVEEHTRRCRSDTDRENCLGENLELKDQVEELKILLRELPDLRRSKNELTALKAEFDNVKSELEKTKSKNVKLMRAKGDCRTLNPQQRHINGLYKSQRLLTKKTKTLEHLIETANQECKSLYAKELKNTKLLGMLLCSVNHALHFISFSSGFATEIQTRTPGWLGSSNGDVRRYL